MIYKIAPDKWRHFFAGIVMGAILQAAVRYLLPARLILAVTITFFLVVAISYGFELISKLTRRGHYDLVDALATIIGGLLGMGFILAF